MRAVALDDEGLASVIVVPAVPGTKESRALYCWTPLMTGIGCLVADPAATLVQTADIVAGLALEALGGTPGGFDRRLYPDQAAFAAHVRALQEGGGFVQGSEGGTVQDAYPLRRVPQMQSSAWFCCA